MTNSNDWKRRHLDTIRYNEKGDVAGPAEDTRQALSDWNRHAMSGTKCPYFINDKQLPTFLNAEQLREAEESKQGVFKNADELRDFFKQHLFPKAPNADQLATVAIAHFHQAGLPHATNFSIVNARKRDPNLQISEPDMKINFMPSEQGLSITEENTYKTWLDTSQGGQPIAHGFSNEKPFRAKTETSYLLKNDGSIEVTELKINCPSAKLKPIFNPQSISMILQDFLARIMKAIQNAPDSESPPPSPRPLP